MIVSTCGFGSTGSSAVSDYLLECENFCVFDDVEFNLASRVDGLEDLEYHLMIRNSRLAKGIQAIRRFESLISSSSREWIVNTKITKAQIDELTHNYINSITQVSFVGYQPRSKNSIKAFFEHYWGESIFLNRFIPYLEKHGYLKKNIDFYPLGEVKASNKPANFYDATRIYVRDLLTAMGCDFSKNIVLDQGFVGNDPAKSFPFFDNPYAIVVDRDPRDLWIFAHVKLLSRGRFMPVDNVDKFITYYRMMRDNQPYKEKNDRIMTINFEDMVYRYESTSSKIDMFLNLKNIRRKSIFDPAMSIANTNLIRKFPQYKKDVKKIEASLSEYLYPFHEFKNIDNSGQMFFGKSLNHKI